MKLFDYLRNKRLVRIARKGKDCDDRLEAVEKIIDKAVLKKIILKVKDLYWFTL
jgi:hypothetical protein